MGIVEGLIEQVAELGGVRVYLLAAGLAFSETMLLLDLIVPGEIGMVLVGAATHEAELSLPVAAASAAAGATIGDTVGYVIGRRYGTAFVDRWAFTRRRLGPALERAHERFHDHGGAIVLLGRWVGALRAVVPIVVGAADMPFRRFFAWNVLASVTWASTVVSVGYFFGRHIGPSVERVGFAISAVVVTVLALRWWRRRRSADQRTTSTGHGA
jgi:membrane-associated protein